MSPERAAADRPSRKEEHVHRTIIIAALAGLTGPVSAQAWLDNFNDGSAVDGSPVTWLASPAFPHQFEVVDGDLEVSMPTGSSPAISSARVDINFKRGVSVRARMRAFNGPGRFTVAVADQATGIQGYVASFSTCDDGKLELFRGDELGSIDMLATMPMPYLPTEEFYIQLDLRDGVVSARAWRPGEPFPTHMLSEPDATYSEGVASIAIQDFGHGDCLPGAPYDDARAIARFAQASSVPLTHSGIGDITADGAVDVADLLDLLGAWGACSDCPPSCPADIAPVGGDCAIDVQDLLALLAHWG